MGCFGRNVNTEVASDFADRFFTIKIHAGSWCAPGICRDFLRIFLREIPNYKKSSPSPFVARVWKWDAM